MADRQVPPAQVLRWLANTTGVTMAIIAAAIQCGVNQWLVLGLIQLFERVDAVGGTVKLGSRNAIASLVTVMVPLHLGGPAMPLE